MTRFKKILIAIPSYWIFSRKTEFVHKGYELYDHPIRVPRYETLSRLLRSMKTLDTKGLEVRIIILVASPHETKRYENLIRHLIGKTEMKTGLDVVFESTLGRIKDKLGGEGYPSVKDDIGLEGYSNVRNAGLFLAQLLDYDAVFFLDDDVVIRDRDLLKRVIETSKRMDAGLVGGVYVNRGGGYVPEGKAPFWKTFWDKNKYINQVFQEFKDKDVLDTILMFGGNMFVSKQIFRKVPFDPLVPRGEDIDYAINAKHFGFGTVLDRGVAVTHLPPRGHRTYILNYWSKLRGDTFRFLYETQKLSAMGMSVDSLPVYPKVFLKNTKLKATATTLFIVPSCITLLDFNSLKENLLNIKRSFWDFPRNAKMHRGDYFRFQREWETLMSVIESERDRGNIPSDIRGWL